MINDLLRKGRRPVKVNIVLHFGGDESILSWGGELRLREGR